MDKFTKYGIKTHGVPPMRPVRWIWRVNINNMPMECEKRYSSQQGAYQAAIRWLEKYYEK